MATSLNLQLVYYIFIAVTGLVGNITTIFVFSQRRLRSLRSSFFLTCLAVTDLLFILIIVVVLLDAFQIPVMTVPVCMLTIYVSHIASFLSSNFTLAYTSHRLIAVLFPIKATTFLTQRTNRILAIALLVFACLFYSLSFHVTTAHFRSNSTHLVTCEEDRSKTLLFPFLVLDTLFTFIIPFSLITCMNLTIVYKLQTQLTYKDKPSTPNSTPPSACSATKSSTNSSGQSISEAPSGSPFKTTQLSNPSLKSSESNGLLQPQNRSLLCVQPIERFKRIHIRSAADEPARRHGPLYHSNTSIRIRSTQCRATASAKTTKMLLAASTVFLVFNLPYHLLLFCLLFKRNEPPWMLSAVNVARLWFFASFCVNFLVYAICGQRFRNEVVRLFSCTSLRRFFAKRHHKTSQERQNSIYFNHRLIPLSLTRISQSN